ncbi:MAG: DUF1722 domain-containing protein [Candidatus Cloacimonetes bacterium]|nr:DUF1722 domain-containing protein [Candidatus Cloacimonadota bacterium]
MNKIILGISSCLLGNNVRYDGQDKLDRRLADELGAYAQFIPVCPEAELGLGIPREAMRLVGKVENPRLVTINTGIDLTERMQAYCDKRVAELAEESLCGFIFKSKSPSSGMEGVKVYPEGGGAPAKTGVGLFARTFMNAFPLLPVEEENRLHDPILRENFVERIFVMQRWNELAGKPVGTGDIVDFHTRHKLLLMAHSPERCRALGIMVAQVKQYKAEDFKAEYIRQMMEALRKTATRRKHQNVMLHILGYIKKDLSAWEKQELISIIDNYRSELYPLIIPLTLINHYVKKYNQQFLSDQYYLNPHPMELNLRNHC